MPNFSSLLKAEITRLARKEVKATTSHLQKAIGTYRLHIAALKRRTAALESQLRQVQRGAAKAFRDPEPDSAGADTSNVRYSARSLISQRRRLGLSAADFGLLFGTTGQAIYNWESGRVRPRRKHMAALAALRKLGKKQAAEIVAARRAS